MNYYFMPRIEGLSSDVTLANYPPHRTAAGAPDTQFVHLAWSDGTKWHVHVIGDIAPDSSLCISSTDLPVAIPEEMFPVLFLDSHRQDGEYERLPSLAQEDTVPAWRANIRLRSASTAASYQGDYPVGMANVRAATLLSIAPLIQSSAEISTELLFVNIGAVAMVDEHEIHIIAIPSRRIMKTAKIWSNRCTMIPLEAIADESVMQVVTCSTATGVPIYFSHDRRFSQMSLEHSHPPIETVVFGKRERINRAMKAAWFTEISR